MIREENWWKQAIIYHIYPRSFQDSNGDGIGDLNGIRSRLDYLSWLGVDAFWLSPVYPSPMADFGYDVSNHCEIDPMFGSLSDMDLLIEEAHSKNLKIILDFVPNHTSNQHPWFLESRSSRINPKRDWYYWKDPASEGGPPNNWLSRFDGESAWKWDETTEQYYLHTFLAEQPDLNWRNPQVRKAMLNVLRFWYDRGVDGFRVDVSYRVMKDPLFRDNPTNPDWKPGMDKSFRLIEKHTKNTPDIHTFNRWIRETNDEYNHRVTIGEMNLSIPELCAHYGTPTNPEFHLPFNFRLVFSEWNAGNIRDLMNQFQESLPDHGWPNWVLSNHDQPRFASRAGKHQLRNGLMFLLTAMGTPTIYYGEEIGMQNVVIPIDQVKDPWELLSPGMGLGRDPERTPMQWDSTKNTGFCPDDITPWLPAGSESDQKNVEVQKKDDTSPLFFFKNLTNLRRKHRALTHGKSTVLPSVEPVLAYVRFTSDQSLFVVLNISSKTQLVNLSDLANSLGREVNNTISIQKTTVLLSTKMDETTDFDSEKGLLCLRPDEGVIIG